MKPSNKYLFNFSASFIGGGYKRLYAFAEYFNLRNGAYFIIHHSSSNLIKIFKKNKFFVVKKSNLGRIFFDSDYLKKILVEIGGVDFYYSYGIPVYSNVAKVNWFHVSNILPFLAVRDIPISFSDKLKMFFLKFRFEKNFKNADIISAESEFSLKQLNVNKKKELFCSPNGCDDEIKFFSKNFKKKNYALIIGTYRYKALNEAFIIFQMLRKYRSSELKLIIVGSKKFIPPHILKNKYVIIKDLIARDQVLEILKETKFYISTTYVENSYNAAAEGIFFADESYISNIEPHLELLKNVQKNLINVAGISRPIVHVRRKDLKLRDIKSWNVVITEMLKKLKVITL